MVCGMRAIVVTTYMALTLAGGVGALKEPCQLIYFMTSKTVLALCSSESSGFIKL